MRKHNILAEDREENINLFNDLINSPKYSKYSSELNKVFSKYSYSKFLTDLSKIEEKKPVTLKHKIHEWLNLSNYSTNKLYPENFDIKLFKKSLNEMKKKEELSAEKRKNDFHKRGYKRKLLSQLTADKVLKIKNRIRRLNRPCIGAYNPIYNAIGKHSYQVKFEQKDFEEFNNTDKFNSLENIDKSLNIKSKTVYNDRTKHEKFNFLKNNKNRTLTEIKTNFSKNKKRKIELHDLTYSKNNKIKINKNNIKDKDLLLFSKLKNKKRNKNNSNIFLNSKEFTNTLYNQSNFDYKKNLTERNKSPSLNIKGNVNFDKISTNKNIGCYFEEMAKKIVSPSIGIYHPNYSSIFSKTKNVFFHSTSKRKNPKIIKKALLNKIITNYNQTIKYELFNILNKKG